MPEGEQRVTTVIGSGVSERFLPSFRRFVAIVTALALTAQLNSIRLGNDVVFVLLFFLVCLFELSLMFSMCVFFSIYPWLLLLLTKKWRLILQIWNNCALTEIANGTRAPPISF